jgi:CubicO group peptidase (beta-lactamase class C family)
LWHICKKDAGADASMPHFLNQRENALALFPDGHCLLGCAVNSVQAAEFGEDLKLTIRNIIIVLVAITGIVGASFGGWYYRPWSDFSPAEMSAASAPDQLVTSFRRMDEIYPSRVIQADPTAISLSRDVANSDVTFDWLDTNKQVSDWLRESDSTGLMVLHNGRVVHEEYFLEADEETRHTSWSVGKSYVATLIAIAQREGHISSLDQTAEMFAPQFGGTAYGETTLRHLLMMSAGVDFDEDYGNVDSDIRVLFAAPALGQSIDTLVGQVERNRAPGEDLHYVSANTQVLSAVVRGVYRAPLAEIIQTKIWEPLGMAGDASWNQNIPGENGHAIGYCCLNARLEEYARFGQFYLQDGVWDGERILPDGWVEMATRPNADFQAAGDDSVYPPRGYGLHFWVPNDHDGEYFMAGVFGQYVWVDERRNIVIARTAADQTWFDRTRESIAAMRALSAHYGDPIENSVENALQTPREGDVDE